MKINAKQLAISLAIPLAVGGLSALLTNSSMEHFESLNQPPLSPPSLLFPIVWTILFILMGISTYLVYRADSFRRDIRDALSVYAVQLFMNFMWSIIFFNMGTYLFAFIWLVVLWILIIIMARMFYTISKPAGLLQLPYILWVLFAGYLNFGIYYLNR